MTAARRKRVRGWSDAWTTPTPPALLAAANLVILALAMGLTLWRDTNGPLAAGAAAIGVITFFGMLSIGDGFEKMTGKDKKDRIRDAITATFIVVYVVLLGLLAFQHFASEQKTSPIADTLVTNFTVLMGVVIAFYFGTTTYEKVKGVAGEDAQKNEAQATGAPGATSAHEGEPPAAT
jgi:membrane protease YdiL (CAAX protease family)